MSKAISIVKINSKLKSKLTKEVSLDGADHINANKLIKKIYYSNCYSTIKQKNNKINSCILLLECHFKP